MRFRSVLAQSQKYRPDIDGLRAIAILPVVFFHAGVEGFSGGYVGVDVFFVISGFLIASVIKKDIDQDSFSFISFYERRMRRIFPALFAMALICSVAAAIFFIPNDFSDFGDSLMAMTAFVSNIYFLPADNGAGYFNPPSNAQALLHTWSLSVEEQFYILFPAALLLLVRQARGREIYYLLPAALASFAISVWKVHSNPNDAFFLLPSRGWELVIGAVLAVRPLPPLHPRLLREAAGLLGLGLIAFAVHTFTNATAFPGVNALFPCLGAWLLIYSGAAGRTLVRGALSFPPLVFIGVISYSLYLWHWPIIIFIKYFYSSYGLSDNEMHIALIASLIMAFISFEWVESPFRGAGSPIRRWQVFSFGMAASALTLAVGFSIDLHNGYPQRYSEPVRAIIAKNVEREGELIRSGRCWNWQVKMHDHSDAHFCEIGLGASRKIMFWGDSHVQQLYPLIQTMYNNGKLQNRGALFAVVVGCLPAEQLTIAKNPYSCNVFSHIAMQRAEEADIDTVFIGFTASYFYDPGTLCKVADGHCAGPLSKGDALRRFIEDLSWHINKLKGKGKNVILSLPSPEYDIPIPRMLIHNAIYGVYGSYLAAWEASSYAYGLRDQLLATAKSTGAVIFDPRVSLCSTGECIYQKDGVSIYKDNSHITTSQIGLLAAAMQKSLDNK